MAALIPAGIEVFKNLGNALSRRIIPKDTEPRTFQEQLELRKLDIEQFKILQDADKAGESYRWVEALRKLQRPCLVIATFTILFMTPGVISPGFVENLVGSVMFYVFGDRSLHYFNRSK